MRDDAMKTQILTHSDEVSGITVLADGTRCYWTEGRGSTIFVRKPDGTLFWFDVDDPGSPENQAIFDEEQRVEEGADEYRMMTPEEEEEWDSTRNEPE